ncbi:MAG: hypothetical protein GC200_10135 [Tepidisphaera sp.]|nr:hypothetical protein [Tepidisphaera sp.]
MQPIFPLAAVLACASLAHASATVQSITSSWHAFVTVDRALSLGGGSDTAGSSASSAALNLTQPITGHAHVGPDFADINALINLNSGPASVTARYQYNITGQIQHPVAADFGQARFDLSLDVRVFFTLDAPTDISLSAATADAFNVCEAAVLDSSNAAVLYVGASQSDTQTLAAGSYEARFLYLGPSLYTTLSAAPLSFSGSPEFHLTLPAPHTLAIFSLAGLFRRHRPR